MIDVKKLNHILPDRLGVDYIEKIKQYVLTGQDVDDINRLIDKVNSIEGCLKQKYNIAGVGSIQLLKENIPEQPKEENQKSLLEQANDKARILINTSGDCNEIEEVIELFNQYAKEAEEKLTQQKELSELSVNHFNEINKLQQEINRLENVGSELSVNHFNEINKLQQEINRLENVGSELSVNHFNEINKLQQEIEQIKQSKIEVDDEVIKWLIKFERDKDAFEFYDDVSINDEKMSKKLLEQLKKAGVIK